MAIGGVINGQPVDAPTTNGAFLKKNGDDTAQGIIGLGNADSASGSSVQNTQAELNANSSYTGKALNSSKDALPSYANNQGFTVSENLTSRASALSGKFHGSTGHTHSGAAGDGAKIAFNNLAGTQLIGYAVRGANLTVTGSSFDATSSLTGKVPSTGDTVKGVVVSTGNNYVHILDVNGDSILDALGNRVYGRLTFNSSTWNLSFYSLLNGTETAFTFGNSTVIEWYYQQLFDESDRPVYSDLFVLQSDQVAGQVPTGSFTVAGKVMLAALADIQPVGSANVRGTITGKAAPADHAHQGVHSLKSDGGTALYGDVVLKAVNATLSQDGTSITITVPAAVASNLASVLAQGNSAGTFDINMNGQNLLAQGFAEHNLVAKPGNPGAGKVRLYVKSDGKIYKLDENGLETAIENQAQALSAVLGVGNSAGTFNIDLNQQALLKAGHIEVQERSSAPPTPPTGYQRVYGLSDGKLYRKKSDGTQTELGAGGGGGSAVQWFQGDTNNVPETLYGNVLPLLDFSEDFQNIFTELTVPEGYTPGTQIKLLGAKFFTGVSTGSALMRVQAGIIRAGLSITSPFSNIYESTNTPIAVTAASIVYDVGQMALTDANGQIQGVAVQPLDTLYVRLYRNISGEGTSVQGPVSVIRNSFTPKFST